MSHIADNLPRVELAANLYPTERMQGAVAELNGYILRFLVRAHDWYIESPWKHMVHSLAQPSELRYTDLLEDISRSSAVVLGLAVSGQQVEFHHMHGKVNEINAKVEEVNLKLEKMSSVLTCKNPNLILLLEVTDTNCALHCHDGYCDVDGQPSLRFAIFAYYAVDFGHNHVGSNQGIPISYGISSKNIPQLHQRHAEVVLELCQIEQLDILQPVRYRDSQGRLSVSTGSQELLR